MAKIEIMCWKCGKDILVTSVSRSSECPDCHADLHCCRNCVYYAPGSHYDCHETVDEIVTDKEKANFCDSFKLKVTGFGKNGGSSGKMSSAEAKKAFNALFND